jgi:hypothetical protein
MVSSYGVRAEVAPPDQHSFNTMAVKVEVEWRPELPDMIRARDEMLGDRRREIDNYHSQFAISGKWLLLNELERKCIKSKTTDELIKDYLPRVNPEWDSLLFDSMDYIRTHLKFDTKEVIKYALDHRTSTLMPLKEEPSLKWTQLTIEDYEVLFELVENVIGYIVEQYDTVRYLIHKPLEIGRGIRARSEPLKDYKSKYEYVVSRSRQVGFAPYLSSWFAFMNDEAKLGLWKLLKDRSESILSTEVLLPPLDKGNYWKLIMEKGYEGSQILNADGSNWESMTSRLLDFYFFAVDDGCYQYLSGTSRTSFDACLANLKLADLMYEGMDVELIGVLGDDRVTIGRNLNKSRIHVPGVMEMDSIATRNQIILGMKLVYNSLGEFRGTYPGTIRISVDRGAKAQPMSVGEWIGGIENDMTADAFEVYFEMACHGSIHGIPTIELISKVDDVDFWDRYSRDRYNYLGELFKNEEGSQEQTRSDSRRVHRGGQSYSLVRSSRYDGHPIDRTTSPNGQSAGYVDRARFYRRGKTDSRTRGEDSE